MFFLLKKKFPFLSVHTIKILLLAHSQWIQEWFIFLIELSTVLVLGFSIKWILTLFFFFTRICS